MSKTLDFTKAKKRFLTVKLDDAEETVLCVNMPNKATYEQLFECGKELDKMNGTASPEEVQGAITAMYEAVAVAMSNNKQGKRFTASDLETMFDIDDLMLFFTTYMDFVGEIASEKN